MVQHMTQLFLYYCSYGHCFYCSCKHNGKQSTSWFGLVVFKMCYMFTQIQYRHLHLKKYSHLRLRGLSPSMSSSEEKSDAENTAMELCDPMLPARNDPFKIVELIFWLRAAASTVLKKLPLPGLMPLFLRIDSAMRDLPRFFLVEVSLAWFFLSISLQNKRGKI